MTHQKTQIAEDGEKIRNDLPPAGTEHADPDAIVIDEGALKNENAEKVQTKDDEDEKPVTLTVTKDHAVFDGDGAYYVVGTKFETDKETAKSLREKGIVK